MKRFLLIFITAVLLLGSCSPYGEKVKINDELEIYTKGGGVTNADAKKLGDYLAELWKDAHNMKSLQLMKEGNTFIVKFAVDEKMVKEDPSLDNSFKAVKTLLETEVFKDNRVSFVITDNTFKDIKSY